MIWWWELENWMDHYPRPVTGAQTPSLYEMAGFVPKLCLKMLWENQWHVADLCHSISGVLGIHRIAQPSRIGWHVARSGREANGVLKDLSLPHPHPRYNSIRNSKRSQCSKCIHMFTRERKLGQKDLWYYEVQIFFFTFCCLPDAFDIICVCLYMYFLMSKLCSACTISLTHKVIDKECCDCQLNLTNLNP